MSLCVHSDSIYLLLLFQRDQPSSESHLHCMAVIKTKNIALNYSDFIFQAICCSLPIKWQQQQISLVALWQSLLLQAISCLILCLVSQGNICRQCVGSVLQHKPVDCCSCMHTDILRDTPLYAEVSTQPRRRWRRKSVEYTKPYRFISKCVTVKVLEGGKRPKKYIFKMCFDNSDFAWWKLYVFSS